MPLVSKAQQKWMFANKPAMAKEWAAETPDIKHLPERVKHGTKQGNGHVGKQLGENEWFCDSCGKPSSYRCA